MRQEPNAFGWPLPATEAEMNDADRMLCAWSSGLFTAWCEAVVTPWHLVPPPQHPRSMREGPLAIPEALEGGDHALFA